jgi:hypothetical protein
MKIKLTVSPFSRESELRCDKYGNILRKDQKETPKLNVGDRFFDCAMGQWATLLRIRPVQEANGAPFEARYDGYENLGSFIGYAMYADVCVHSGVIYADNGKVERAL